VAEGIDDEGQSEHDPLFGLRRSACEKTKIPAQPEHRHGWRSGGNITTRGRGCNNPDRKPVQAGQPLQIPMEYVLADMAMLPLLQCKHNGFHYLTFYNFIVDFFEDIKDDAGQKNADELLDWWNWYIVGSIQRQQS
jgi:hypothetical protein